MSTPTNSPAPKSASGAPAAAAGAPAPSFEEQLRTFWEKNSTLVTGFIAAIILAVLGKGAWDYFAAQREHDVQQEYAVASTSAALKTFATAHPDHTLAGVAQLRIADEAYTAGKYADAISGYEQAAASLKTGPLASRARLGLGVSKLLGGHVADGEAALKAIANDPNEIKPYRLEAIYHLATTAAEAGRATELKAYTEQIGSLDATSPWAVQAMKLRVGGK